jgi:hypothetical protein
MIVIPIDELLPRASTRAVNTLTLIISDLKVLSVTCAIH